MSGDGVEAAANPAAPLDASLFEAKLSVPPARPGAVSRDALIARARATGSRVVGVTAPAGYGKSTLLSQWARAEDRPVGWVSLHRFDDDPVALLVLMASAYSRIWPDDGALAADMAGVGVSVLGRAAPRLASAFAASPGPFVLMLDDLHEVRSPACHDALSVAIDGVPDGSQVVTASRVEQPHLPRLRASGDVIELVGSDLALDVGGARQIFSQAGVSVSEEEIAAVTARTEGWAVGLSLAALIASDGDGSAAGVSGDDRYVADYLYRESMLRLPEPDRTFLRRTAVLDQMCAPLCDAVLEESGTQARLRALEASNAFLVPLDRRREWYRYHALYREFLLSELRRVEPDVIATLHTRAADWYQANGSPTLALEHLFDTEQQDRCVALVTELLLPTYLVGQVSTVERWLDRLGDEAIEAYPPLAVLAGWVAALSGDAVGAQRWAAFLETASFEGTPADGTASFASARAMLRSLMCPSGPEQSVTDADLALAQEPPWSAWRGQALGMAGEAYLLAGDQVTASRLFEELVASPASETNTDAYVIALAELAVLAIDRGQWDESADHIRLALAAIAEHRMDDYSTSVTALAAAARLALHQGDADRADQQLARAMRARPVCTYALPGIAVRARLQLALAHRSLGEHSTARHLLREIDDILLHRPALGALVDDVEDLRGLLEATAEAVPTGGPPLSPAELRLLPYLQTHLTIREIADRLYVSRNTVSSQVSSIYRKLAVTSRSEAVQQASAVGLLGG